MTTKVAAIERSELAIRLDSFIRELKAENKSPKTVTSYQISITKLLTFLGAKGMPLHLEGITREHVQEFMIDHLNNYAPATASLRYVSLNRFFKWLVEEGQIKANPMERIKAPRIPENPPAVLTEDEIKRLLGVCERDKTFAGQRDTAIVRVLLDTGARIGEVAGLMLWRDLDKKGNPDRSSGDVDLDRNLLYVIGKGRRPRHISMGNKTVRALDRYFRARARHNRQDEAGVWLGRLGKLAIAGIAQILRRRGKEAGLHDLHAHLFRHTGAHLWQQAGGSEAGLMKQFGWKTTDMVRHYGASAATERAHAEHRRLGIGDKY